MRSGTTPAGSCRPTRSVCRTTAALLRSGPAQKSAPRTTSSWSRRASTRTSRSGGGVGGCDGRRGALDLLSLLGRVVQVALPAEQLQAGLRRNRRRRRSRRGPVATGDGGVGDQAQGREHDRDPGREQECPAPTPTGDDDGRSGCHGRDGIAVPTRVPGHTRPHPASSPRWPCRRGQRPPCQISTTLPSGAGWPGYGSRPSSRSVTRAAMGLRSLRVRVTWANSGCPFMASMTAATPS